MGKRELLLIVAFVIVGAVVYQATAPPAGPNERSLSLTRLIDHVRREMRGRRANAETTKVTTHQVDASMTELRVANTFAELTITGENRSDIEASFRATSNGYDDEEAKRLLSQTLLLVDRAGPTLRLTSKYPDPGQQRAWLTVRVPARLTVRVEPGASRTSVSNVAGVEMGVRGETSIKQIAGRVTLTHRAGPVTIEDVSTLKLTGRGSDATVTRVKGDASFSMQAGELTAASITGSIDVETQNSEVTFKKLEELQGPLRVNALGGSVTLEGLKGEARVDARNTEVAIVMSKAAPVAVYNEGDEPIEITVPPGGFVLDALATGGRISMPEEFRGRVVTSGDGDDRERRANGPVRGGGPTITLRANRGDIRVVARETSKDETKKR